MDSQHPVLESFQNFPEFDSRQFLFSNSFCGFESTRTKLSSCSWVECNSRVPLANASTYWGEPCMGESYGVMANNQPLDAPQYWDNFDCSSYPKETQLSCGLFQVPFTLPNYPRQIDWSDRNELAKNECSDVANFLNGGTLTMSCGKASDCKESFDTKAVSHLASVSYPTQKRDQCLYSSQCQSQVINQISCVPTVPPNLELTKLNPEKKKRKREINKFQRQAANLRERKRMNRLNSAFEQLWQKMPKQAFGQFSKNLSSQIKFSRVFILRSALCYIEYLKGLLDGNIEANPEQLSSTLSKIE